MGLASWCLINLSTLFQLPVNRSGQLYCRRKPENLAITIGLTQITVKLLIRIYKHISKWLRLRSIKYVLLVYFKLWRSLHCIKNEQQKKTSPSQQGQISQRMKRCYMYDDTVGACYQSVVLLSCYMYIANCSVTFGMSGNRLNVKLSETDILFLLILKVLDWNITWMLDGASLVFMCFILCFC